MLPLPLDPTASPHPRQRGPPAPGVPHAAADTHSSGFVEHQLLDRADDGGSGGGHGSSERRPHYRAPGRSPGRDSRLTGPGTEGGDCRHSSPHRAQKNQRRCAKPSAARCRRVLPDSPSHASHRAPPIGEGAGLQEHGVVEGGR